MSWVWHARKLSRRIYIQEAIGNRKWSWEERSVLGIKIEKSPAWWWWKPWEQTTKLREQEPMKMKDNQSPSFHFPSTALVPGLHPQPLLPPSSSKSCHRKLLKAQLWMCSPPRKAFRRKCRLLSFVLKAHYGLCQMYHFIFISQCSFLTTPEGLTLPQTGHLLLSLALPCHFPCPDGKKTWLWHQKYFLFKYWLTFPLTKVLTWAINWIPLNLFPQQAKRSYWIIGILIAYLDIFIVVSINVLNKD